MRILLSLYNPHVHKPYYVYIIGNTRPTLYIGVTNNLIKRIYEHKNGLTNGFTKRYFLKSLLYYEEFTRIEDAINREKQLKHWNREWKIELIKQTNPGFRDLYPNLL